MNGMCLIRHHTKAVASSGDIVIDETADDGGPPIFVHRGEVRAVWADDGANFLHVLECGVVLVGAGRVSDPRAASIEIALDLMIEGVIVVLTVQLHMRCLLCFQLLHII